MAGISQDIIIKGENFILAGAGFIGALAWNDVIQEVIDRAYPLSKNTIWLKVIYAIVVSVIIALLIIFMDLFGIKEEQSHQKKPKPNTVKSDPSNLTSKNIL